MGRRKRGVGDFDVGDGGVVFECMRLLPDGSGVWTCHNCGEDVPVSESAIRRREKGYVFSRHLPCVPRFRSFQSGPPLEPSLPGEFVAVVRGGVADVALVAAARDACSVFTGGGKDGDRLSLGGSDFRGQEWFLLGALPAVGAVIRPLLRSANVAHRGTFLRGERACVIWGGKGDQPSHCDFMRGVSGEYRRDSMSGFVCIGAKGRWFGVQGPGRVERIWLEPGDVMFVSAGAYHCGLENSERGSDVLFFYLDRNAQFSSVSGRGEVGPLWSGLSPAQQAQHLVALHFSSGAEGVTSVLKRLFREAAGNGKLRPKARPRLV